MKRHRPYHQKNTPIKVIKPMINQGFLNFNWVTAPAGLLLMMIVYYFVGRQGQNVTYTNNAQFASEDDLGSSDALFTRFGQYEPICTSSPQGLFFSNRVPYKNSSQYYPLACWDNGEESRVGVNFTTDEEKEDFTQAEIIRGKNYKHSMSDSVVEKSGRMYAQYKESYFKFYTLLAADENITIKELKYRFPLDQLNNLLQTAYLQYHIREGIQCGDSADLNIVRILMQTFPLPEAAPNFLRLHFKLPHDKPVVPDFIHLSEHSTLVLFNPGAVTVSISKILEKHFVSSGPYVTDAPMYGSNYQVGMSGFNQARSDIIDLMLQSEGLECDAWTPFIGKFPGHCVSKIFINNENLITHIRFLDFNNNPLIARLLEFFTTTYPEVYEWLLAPGVETKEALLPKMRA